MEFDRDDIVRIKGSERRYSYRAKHPPLGAKIRDLADGQPYYVPASLLEKISPLDEQILSYAGSEAEVRPSSTFREAVHVHATGSFDRENARRLVAAIEYVLNEPTDD